MAIDTQAPKWQISPVNYIMWLVVLAGLVVVDYVYELAFISLVELFVISITMVTFLVTWHSMRYFDDDRFLFLGINMFFIAIFVGLHFLSYEGIAVFGEATPNVSTQFRIIGSYFLVLAFLGAPVYSRRRFPPIALFITLSALTAAFSFAVFAGVFPAAYADGLKATPFMMASEYSIIGLLGLSSVLLFKKHADVDTNIALTLIASIVAAMIAEIVYSFPSSFHDTYNMIAHLFHLAGFYMIYLAMVATVLEIPQAMLNRELKRLSVTDSLTTLSNSRFLHSEIDEEFSRARRYGYPFSLIMFDLDDFKHFNDMFGHLAGDAVLKHFAAIMRRTLRDIDIAARYGGEEFMAVLPNTDSDGALAVAERIRETTSRERIMDSTLPYDSIVTVSGGVASYPRHKDNKHGLISAADSAMYQAKRLGKNRIVVFGEESAIGQQDPPVV